MRRVWTGLVASGTGGLIAGILLGLTEVISLVILGSGWGGFSTLFWAIAAYGTLGLLGGMVLGFLGSLLLGRWLSHHANWWMLAGGAAIFGGAGLIVMRFRLLRDLFQERASLLSLESLAMHAVLLSICGGILVAAWFVGRRWSGPRSKPATSSGSGEFPSHSLHVGQMSRAVGSTQLEGVSSPATVPPTPAIADGLSRRTFLKASLATGLLALPAAAAASRIIDQGPSAFATINISDSLRSKLRDKPNIIVIIADTLRADHVGVNGYAQVVTPHLDALAAQSVHFTNAFAQSSWTKPSVATLLTSLYPSSHTAIYKTSALPSSVVTLPEVLSSHGYVTGGLANNINVAPLFNFQKGFNDYEFLTPSYLLGASEASSQLAVYQVARKIKERVLVSRKNVGSFYQPAEVVNERAIDWLESQRDDRFFLFLHYMEPHDPYFEHPYNNYGIARVSMPDPPADMAPELVRLYDGEITYLDQKLGELFEWLKRQDLYDETLIVFTADHGEEFHEHGGWWHGLTLYEEQIHVPLFLKMPAQAMAGTVDADLARLLDIAPTVLRAAGFDVPQVMQGLDLLDESQKRAKFAFAEEDHQGNVLRAGRSLDWKFIEANADNPRGLPTRSLFHLAKDPGETRNLSESEPDKVAMALERLGKVSVWAEARAVTVANVELDQIAEDAIKKTGYGR